MNISVTSTLRKSLSAFVFVAGAFAASAHGQIGRQQVRVAIPFAFQDGSTHLDSGLYTVGLETGNIMLVRGNRGTRSAMSIVSLSESRDPLAKGKVVFHKYGNRYFLSEVWMTGASSHLECPRSKAEITLQKELQLASNKQPSTGTEVSLLELPR